MGDGQAVALFNKKAWSLHEGDGDYNHMGNLRSLV